VNIVYVPYGNAQIDMDNKVVTCQHGDTECDLNTYEQCAIDVYPAAADYLPFIACLEGKRSLSRQPAQALADCSAEAGLDFAPVQECHDDEDRAWDLNVKNAGLTPADHQYTPWVELDGELYVRGEARGAKEGLGAAGSSPLAPGDAEARRERPAAGRIRVAGGAREDARGRPRRTSACRGGLRRGLSGGEPPNPSPAAGSAAHALGRARARAPHTHPSFLPSFLIVLLARYDDSVDFQTALCTAYTAKGGSSDACKAAIM
jgi:interferon gamma-inducible protein 30